MRRLLTFSLLLSTLLGSTLACDVPAKPLETPHAAPLLQSSDPMLSGKCPANTLPYGGEPPSHSILSCRREDGTAHGISKTWDILGRIKEEGHFKDGQREGLWIAYFKSGRHNTEGSYQQGQKHGRWTAWRKNGSVRAHTWYEHGKVVAIEHPQGR